VTAGSVTFARRRLQTLYISGMTTKPPNRKSNAELAEEALAKAKLYRARAREEERRAAGEFGLWVQGLAAKGDPEALSVCNRWAEQQGIDPPVKAAPEPREKRVFKPRSRHLDDPGRPIRTAQNWPVVGLELVSGQVRELVRQGKRLEARGLIVKAEQSTGMPLVPAAHRAKWGLGSKAGEIVGPLA
jgi:hypothetical protein